MMAAGVLLKKILVLFDGFHVLPPNSSANQPPGNGRPTTSRPPILQPPLAVAFAVSIKVLHHATGFAHLAAKQAEV